MKFKKYRKLLVCATPHTAVKQMTQLPVKAFEQPSKIQSSHAVLSLPYSRCLLSPFTLTQAACFPLIKAKVFCLYPSSQVQTHSYSSFRSPVPAFKLTWVLSDFVVREFTSSFLHYHVLPSLFTYSTFECFPYTQRIKCPLWYKAISKFTNFRRHGQEFKPFIWNPESWTDLKRQK